MDSAGRRPRVLIIVQNLPVPFDRRVWLESTTLQRNGYDVSVVCPKLRGFNKSRETIEDVDIYRYAMPLDPTSKVGFALEFVWAWIRTFLLTFRIAVQGRGFDVIHACNPPETYWLLARLWKLFGKRFLFDHHDLSPEMYKAKFGGGSRAIIRGLEWLERRTFRAADVVVTTNESHKKIAVDRGGVDPQDIFVVRSGPDLARFSEYQPDPQWRQGKEHVIAYLGEIGDQDGVDGLVRVIKILSEDLGRDDFHAVFIGDGAHRATVMTLAEELGVSDRCTFTGTVSDEDLCRILSSVDIGVDPVPKNDWSDKSTMNKIVEYMYFGLPVVAFDLVEARFSAGDAGAYATPNSDREMAEVVATLFDDPQLRAQMSDIGRRRLREELAWDHSAPILLAAYERAIAK